MAQPPGRRPLIDRLYQRYLIEENSADFVRNVCRNYTLGTLERLAASGRRITRRGAILAIGFVGDMHQNVPLGRALLDIDRAVRLLADNGIRQVWFRVGDPGVEWSLRRVAQLNQQRRFGDALALASRLLRGADGVAEVWNQRAIARYALGDYESAIEDCQQTLERNAYHFSAAMGIGHCHLQLDQPFAALDSFRRALVINPDLENVRGQVQHLQRILEEP